MHHYVSVKYVSPTLFRVLVFSTRQNLVLHKVVNYGALSPQLRMSQNFVYNEPKHWLELNSCAFFLAKHTKCSAQTLEHLDRRMRVNWIYELRVLCSDLLFPLPVPGDNESAAFSKQ